MKKRIAGILLLICLLAMAIPSCADTGFREFTDRIKEMNADNLLKFWKDENGAGYARWDRVSGGVNFSMKMQSKSQYYDIVGYTFEISAKDAYEDPIMLDDRDGAPCLKLYYTGKKTFRPGKSGFTESFAIRSDEKIRYITARLVQYKTSSKTVYIDERFQPELCWKIK